MLFPYIRQYGAIALLVVMTCLSSVGYASGTLTIVLKDQSGSPVEGGVISVTGVESVSVNRATRVMDQVNMSFVPHVLLVNAGDDVSFPNSDNIRHHVYSFSEPKVFEIRLYADKPEAPLRFDQPGLVVLGCNIHDSMLGYIYVSPTPYAAISDGQGNAVLGVPDEYSGVAVWHEHYALSETEQLMISRADLEAMRDEAGQHVITIELENYNEAEDEKSEGFGNFMRR